MTSMAAATALAFAYAHAAAYQQRGGMPIDPAAQLRCVLYDPLHFLRVIAGDLAMHARYYLDGTIGRFGLNELSLPAAIVILEVLTLIAAAFSSTRAVSTRNRC